MPKALGKLPQILMQGINEYNETCVTIIYTRGHLMHSVLTLAQTRSEELIYDFITFKTVNSAIRL